MPEETPDELPSGADRTSVSGPGRVWMIHPFLFAVFPVLFVYGHNIRQFSPDVMVVPGFFLLLATALLLGVLALALRNPKKAGLVVSLSLLLFFSYGPVYRVFPRPCFVIWGIRVEPTKTVFISWALLFAGGIWYTARTKSRLHHLTKVLNISALVLVAISAFNIATYEFVQRGKPGGLRESEQAGRQPASEEHSAKLPDIYYIIMDAYAREDILKRIYHHDNSGFTEYLREEKGFYVAEGSTSNYANTGLSVASALNMNYISDLLPEMNEDSGNVVPLRTLADRSEVFRFLKKRGYTIVAFSSGYELTEMANADIYLTPGWFADEFENALLDMTPIWVLFKRFGPAQQHRARLLYMFDCLGRLADRHSPKFVFAHLVAPHRPFVFDADGGPVDPEHLNRPGGTGLSWLEGKGGEDYRKFYKNELIYLNRKLRETIDRILANSDRPAIIVLQGDHGPRSSARDHDPPTEALKERFHILNAYHLPGQARDRLYPTITPVNSFAVILNYYFGAQYALHEDRSFYSTRSKPYAQTDVTAKVRGGTKAGSQGQP